MIKIFYYPLFFKLRLYGDVPAIVVATVIVFLLTWLLHSYQWFWLRGDFPIIWQDGIFWMTLALLVVVGALREFRRGRARTLSTTQETLDDKIKRGLQIGRAHVELQSLMRISYAVFCLKKKTRNKYVQTQHHWQS